MPPTDEPGRLLIRHSPPAYLAAGAVLAGLGGLALLAAFGLSGGGWLASTRFRVGIGLAGFVAAAAGAWIFWRAPLSALVVDPARKSLTVVRRGLFGTATDHYPTAAIADVRVRKERDGKGAPAYRVELVLSSGSLVPLRVSRPSDREGCMRAAERLWAALGLPRD